MVTCVSNAVNSNMNVVTFVKISCVQKTYFVKFRIDCFNIEVADNDIEC
jgi:hypothetical protein